MNFSDLQYLTIYLPEDISKLKWFGDFERALRVIDLRLLNEIPLALRRRLELEKEVLKRLPEAYPYTGKEAYELLAGQIKDFSEAELEQLRDEGAIDWIYVYGEVRYKDNCLKNLIKTSQSYTEKLKDRELLRGQEDNSVLLDQTIRRMKEQKKLAYRIRIRAELKVKKERERLGETIRVHLPLPLKYAQVKNFCLLDVSPEPILVSASDYPQRTVYFEGQLEADQTFAAEYEFENHMKYEELNGEQVSAVQPEFCMEEQLPHIRFTPYIRELVNTAVGEETNPLLKARKIYDFITTKVMYSFVRPYIAITDIPGYTAANLKGDCGLQALLFITMCRCARIPARWQAGLYATPLEIGCHDWAQFYIAPYGWLYADCSFGGSAYRAGAKERWDFYFGNLDPFRVPLAGGFQSEFAPPKQFIRNDPYDNQIGEAEYGDVGLNSTEYVTEQRVLLIEPVEAWSEGKKGR